MMQITQMILADGVEADWKFWLGAVAIPVILFLLTRVLLKQSKIDTKFETLGQTTVVFETNMKTLTETTRELSGQVEKMKNRDRDQAISDEARLGEVRLEMERRFVTRREFERLEENLQMFTAQVREQNQKVLQQLSRIGGHDAG